MFNVLGVHGFKYMSWVQVVYGVKFMSVQISYNLNNFLLDSSNLLLDCIISFQVIRGVFFFLSMLH